MKFLAVEDLTAGINTEVVTFADLQRGDAILVASNRVDTIAAIRKGANPLQIVLRTTGGLVFSFYDQDEEFVRLVDSAT